MFADDAKRGEKFTAEAAGLFLDYSKNRITSRTLKLLLELAEESGLRRKIDAMFAGEKINITENRAVLHIALRAPKNTTIRAEVGLTGVYQSRRRMTLTYPVLNRSRRVLWVINGSEKAEALARLRKGEVSIPAGRICRDRATIINDQLAAGIRPETKEELCASE